MANDIRFLIGVDGGGTSCRAAIARFEDGRVGPVLGQAQTGSSNITTDLEGATKNILGAVHEAVKVAGLAPDSTAHAAACLGLAGAGVGDFAQRLSKALPFKMHRVCGDAEIALQGALGDTDGAIAILGTGSAFMARRESRTRLIGGWGFQLSDLGGGARLGRASLEATLLAHDGVIEHSALTRALMTHFSGVPENLVLFVQTATPSDYGAFARIVIQHLGEEDAHAKRLFGESASAVDAAFDALNLKDGDKIALLGGLSSFFPSHLAKRHQERLIAPKADALMGAVALAAKLAAGTLLQSQGRA